MKKLMHARAKSKLAPPFVETELRKGSLKTAPLAANTLRQLKLQKTMCAGRAQLLALAVVAATQAFSLRPRATQRTRLRAAAVEEFDVVVIGSGIGGLSCASLLAAAGREVCVLEAHYELGGCAHEYDVDLDGKTIPSEKLKTMDPRPPTFKFEAGPSLYSGFSPDRSPNPLKHVYQMIGEEPEWITYDKWAPTSRRLPRATN